MGRNPALTGRRAGRQITVIATPDSEVIEGAAKILLSPDSFARHFLGHKLWGTQREILLSLAKNQRTAVRACHASSKTFAAAEAVLWWIARYQDGIAITTAPTWSQVKKVLWSEIKKAAIGSTWPFPASLETEIRIGPGNYAMGLSTDEGVRFQGFHGRVLIVADEGVGIPADIWEAIEGIAAGGQVHILTLGNPTESGGRFYELFGETAWTNFAIDAFNTPNFKGVAEADIAAIQDRPWRDLSEDERAYLSVAPWPMLITRRWVWERFWAWGPDSPVYQSRVRGNFPEQDPTALFSLLMLEHARHNEVKASLPLEAGIDVAGPGDDETVAYDRSGDLITGFHAWRKPDPRGDIVQTYLPVRDTITLKVDAVGQGWHVYTYLLENGFNAVPFKASNKPSPAARKNYPDMEFYNLKAEAYWDMRERFRRAEIGGLVDDVTIAQLAAIRYEERNNKVMIEPKKDMRKRGEKSPDRAEALIMAFAEVTAPAFGVF